MGLDPAPANASTPPPANGAAVGIGIGLSVLILLLWALTLATLADLAGSDAAGNALAQAYAAIELIALWLLLAALAGLAWLKGKMPGPAALAALILIPASGFAALEVLTLLAKPEVAPFRWPIVIPALVPVLLVMFCFWALLPRLRAAIPARAAAGAVWGAILILCLSILPFQQMRDRARAHEAAARDKYAADFANLPADSPLWSFIPFLATPDDTRSGKVLERIGQLARRQSDAEVMLERGDFPLRYLGAFDLTPTPALCDKARSLLRRRVAPLVLKTPKAKPYREIAAEVDGAVAAMNWLIDYDCSCDAESKAWEAMAKAYRDPGYDVYRLAGLRDPKRLGRALYEGPARFSMLTPKAHLKAWLKFTEDRTLRAQALAGARRLDHRTADAVEMLGKDEFASRLLLEYLPLLDLDATPPLCRAALAVLRSQFGKIYRPRADDPRSYQELLGRLGRGEHFSALIWLASHGCDADAAVGEAEGLVRTYQDSPARTAVLAELAQLHRKP
jgi:hypothetical protein